jgi:tetratricopeptide (TPR) repeat protein
MQALAAARAGQLDAAAELYERSYWAAAELGHDRQMARAAMGLAEIHGVQRRDFETARIWERHAASAIERAGDESTRRVHENLQASVRLAAGRYDEAASVLEAAIARVDPHAPDATESTAVALTMLHNLGAAYGRTGRFDEAEVVLERALALARERLGETHPQTASSVAQLGVLRATQGDHEGSVTRYREALALLERWSSQPQPWHPRILGNLGGALGMLERYEESAHAYEQAIAAAEALAGPEHPELPRLHENLERARELGATDGGPG